MGNLKSKLKGFIIILMMAGNILSIQIMERILKFVNFSAIICFCRPSQQSRIFFSNVMVALHFSDSLNMNVGNDDDDDDDTHQLLLSRTQLNGVRLHSFLDFFS